MKRLAQRNSSRPMPLAETCAAVLCALVFSAAASDLRVVHFDAAGTIGITNTFLNGIVTIEQADSIDGPFRPSLNAYTTNSVTWMAVRGSGPAAFYRPLAVDLSGGRAGFTNLASSFSTLSTLAGAGGIPDADVNKWRPEFEGGPATNALLSRPHIAMADDAGNIYVADKDAHAVRKILPDGTLVTVAGINARGDGPDAGLGTACALNEPNGLWVRGDGTVYILDLQNGKIRRLRPDGAIATLFAVPGGITTGRGLWVSDDESLAYVSSRTIVKKWTPEGGVVNFAAGFNRLGNLAVNPQGNLVVTDRESHSVYRLSTDGSARTRIAGNGSTANSPGGGDGGLATLTALNFVRAIWFLPTGACFLGTDEGSQVWFMDTDGLIHLFLNGDATSHQGDGTYFYNPAEPRVSHVRQITADREGNLLIAEHDSGYIRKVRFLRRETVP